MFGIEFLEASTSVALMIALLAGVMSFLSPCVLPIVPPYLAYMAGSTMDEITDEQDMRKRSAVILSALSFVLGLSTVFVILGLAASAVGQLFLQYQDIFAQVAGVVIVIFGLHFLGVFRIGILYREARVDAGDQGGSIFGAYVLGLAFAFGWTPCIGPILGSILSLAAQEASFVHGMMLMGVYAIGLGIPFLLAAIFIRRFMGVMIRFRKHMGLVEKAMGVLLIAVGVMMFTGLFTSLAFWLLETFPILGIVG
ncbi:MAG: cytochrome c biogenesis protein CcdA [Pseudomonadota bacterium]